MTVRIFHTDSSTRRAIQLHMFEPEHEKRGPSVSEFCFNEENKESEEERSGGAEMKQIFKNT